MSKRNAKGVRERAAENHSLAVLEGCRTKKLSYVEDAERRSSAEIEDAGLSNPDLGQKACRASFDLRQDDPCQVPLFRSGCV